MTDSILNSVKKMLGIDAMDTAFDTDLIIHINSSLSILHHLGVGSTAFHITGSSETWTQLLNGKTDIDLVKTYVFAKARKIFDPPTASAVMNALNETINECEWRINAIVDPGEET